MHSAYCTETLTISMLSVLIVFAVQHDRDTFYLHQMYVYAYMCVYAYTGANFFLLFLILSVEKDTTLLTLQKITVFPGTTKVGPICPTFIRGDPYELHRRPEKVTFSDHQFGWF